MPKLEFAATDSIIANEIGNILQLARFGNDYFGVNNTPYQDASNVRGSINFDAELLSKIFQREYDRSLGRYGRDPTLLVDDGAGHVYDFTEYLVEPSVIQVNPLQSTLFRAGTNEITGDLPQFLRAHDWQTDPFAITDPARNFYRPGYNEPGQTRLIFGAPTAQTIAVYPEGGYLVLTPDGRYLQINKNQPAVDVTREYGDALLANRKAVLAIEGTGEIGRQFASLLS